MAEETTKYPKKKLNQVKLSEVLYLTLKRWPWLLLSVVVCVGLAYLHLMVTPPSFTRTASILIKDDKNGSSYSADVSAFADLGLFKSNNNVVDEINKLESYDLMKEVVKSLKLDMSYGEIGRFRDQVLYGSNLPVNVEFKSLTENEGASMKLDIAKDGTYTISELNINKDENIPVKTTGKVKLGQPIAYKGGVLVVTPTPFYKPGEKHSIKVSKMPIKGAVNAYSSKINILLKDEKGNTLVLTATDTSAERAEDLLNGVVDQYNNNWITRRSEATAATSNFINERLQLLEGELGTVDEQLSEYRSQNLVPDVEKAAVLYMNENQETAAKIMELNSRLQNTRYMRSFLTNPANKNLTLPSNSAVPGTTLELQINAYNEKMAERNAFAANSSPENPLVVDMDVRLADLRNSIEGTIKAQEHSLQTEISSLQSSKSQTTARLAAAPAQAKDLESIGRQQNVKQKLYLYLLEKREENELSQSFINPNSETIAEPTGPDAPTSPSSKRLLFMAFVMGLFIPFATNYTLERLNTKIRNRKELEGLKMPILGEIPKQKFPKGTDPECAVVVEQGKRNLINEAFRVLRTNLTFMTSQTNLDVVMITSFNPGSGKSFIGINLGITLAIRNQKVLVIDGDLRHMSTSMYVGTPRRGLTNYLIGETDDINSLIVCDTITPNLSVLPVGNTPPNPSELLESPRFAELIDKLRGQYDYIFIDCPPVEMMADAQIISGSCDRTLFVVRAGLLDRIMLPEIERLYSEKKFPGMSLVLNGTAVDSTRLGSKYGYGYGYNYSAYAADTK